MAHMKSNSETTIGNIGLAVLDIVKPENLNRWISVREQSITSVLKRYSVDVNYSSAFVEELRGVGLVETRSLGAGMRYMVRTTEIPDLQFLARKIYENHLERRRARREQDGYTDSSSTDLRPTPRRDTANAQMRARSGAVRVVPMEIARLGEIGYIILHNTIVEVRVVGVYYKGAEMRDVWYDVEYSAERDGDVVWRVEEVNARNQFFRTVETARASIPVRKYKGRPKA